MFVSISSGGAPPEIKNTGIKTVALPRRQFHKRVKPLMDLIARGEGNDNSVNRGSAGDTPQGIDGMTGKDFKDFTVAEVLLMQRSSVYAVGRYQFIPKTLRFAVDKLGISGQTKFTNELQDHLFSTLITHKRPLIREYILGKHTNITKAVDELSKEWASVEYRNGKSYYNGIGGNAVHITRAEATKALEESKAS